MTLFERIKGQEQAIGILKKSIKENKIASSYLFHGPEGVGKFTTALHFAMAVNCLAHDNEERPCGSCPSCRKILSLSHPDFVYIFPAPNYKFTSSGEIEDAKSLTEYESFITNKRDTPWKEFFFSGNVEIRIVSIRLLFHRINLSVIEGRYKVFIIENAEMMNVATANAFLKTLEEPPSNTIIILTSSRPESLLMTIHSRCQKIAFYKLSRDIIEAELINKLQIENVAARVAARIADGNMKKAINLAEEQSSDSRSKALSIIQFAINRDDLAFIEFIEEYKSLKTQSELKDIIRNLIVWLSDLMFAQEAPEEVVNIDNIEFLDPVGSQISSLDAKIKNIVHHLESLLKKLDGNVNPHLIGIDIYFKLRKLFS
jgi:DNA polymerase-3 subunit delta'